MWTRRSLAQLLIGAAGCAGMNDGAAAAAAKIAYVPFGTAPFPYDGKLPDTDRPFLDVAAGTRRGHTSPRGGVYFEDQTYGDRHVLLAIPPRAARDPAAIVVFLHGNQVRLARDVVGRQKVVAQLVASGLGAVLVAPQFAVDALDSSAGQFWRAGHFAAFLDEAAEKLSALGGLDRDRLARLPVVLVAYSGGYNPAAAILAHGGAGERIAGLVLMDALYAEAETFADWLGRENRRVFFFSAFSPSSAPGNLALQADLRARGIAFGDGLPKRLAAGTAAFLATGPVVHNDFVTRAWVADPLRAVFSRIAMR